MTMDRNSDWHFLFLVLENTRSRIKFIVSRIRLIVWLLGCLPLVFRGCEEYPVPSSYRARLAWYKRRFFGWVRFCIWMLKD